MARTNLTRLAEVLDNGNSLSHHVGIDVHKRSYHLAFRREDGFLHTFVSPADPQFLITKLMQTGINVARIVYEAGPTGFGLARALGVVGYKVAVVAPSRVPRPVTAGAKTDRLDCIRLAEYSARDMIQGIAVPTEVEEAERSVIRRRHDLTDSIRRVKQRIRSLLLFSGIPEPDQLKNWSKKSAPALLKLPMLAGAKMTLRSLVRELIFLEKEKKQIERQLEHISSQARHSKEISCLQSVQGVGAITAATFRLELFDPERFQNVGEVVSLLGLAPMVRQSGEGKARGKLRPVGQKRLRSLLIEAAWGWKSRDSAAAARYGKVLARCGTPQKAICALARHLAGILWRLLVEKRHYEIRQMA